jgi:succinate-semialdehyde dehydrogenase/glutarate-semialdehyde dehydrogenase
LEFAIPALMAGCGVIIKPSEITPRFAEHVRQAIAKTEGLSSVFDIIDGDGETGATLVDHVDAICFTGSVKTGRLVAERAARNFIPAFLELGGNDPALVLEDADLDRAATSLLRASILNTGQACQSIERIYVARPLYDDFVKKLVAGAEKVRLNKDDVHDGHIGPLILGRQGDIIESQLEDARSKGADVLCGGVIERDGGTWCRPTVIVNVSADMSLMRDETFGPILPVVPFDTDEEAIALANDTEFGLSAAVFSENIDHAISVAQQIDAGGISINEASLTGFVHEAEKNSFKLSGMGGSRMGPAGLTRFFRKKALIQSNGPAMDIDMFNENSVRPNDN